MFNIDVVGFSEEYLLRQARVAAKRSYSPYSNFPVGAVVVPAEGVQVSSCNIENASYGLTMCAERAAIFGARFKFHDMKILAIAVSCLNGDPKDPASLMPCGACLQVIQEFSTPETVVLVDGVGTFLLEQLLPKPFKLPDGK